MQALPLEIVSQYAPREALSQTDLIEIGNKLPLNFLSKCLKIIFQTFSFISFIKKSLDGYFANYAVEKITAYNYEFVKTTFIPNTETFSLIKGYLDAQPTSILANDNALYKKINDICRACDILHNVHREKDSSFLITAFDLSTEIERKELCQSRNLKPLNSLKLSHKAFDIDNAAVDLLNPQQVPDEKIKIADMQNQSLNKVLAHAKQNPNKIISTFITEVGGKYLKAEQLTQLQSSLDAISSILNHSFLEEILASKYLSENEKEQIDNLIKLLGEDVTPSRKRQSLQNLSSIISDIIDAKVDEKFIKDQTHGLNTFLAKSPGIEVATDLFVAQLFSPFVPDIIKIPATKGVVNKGLDEYFTDCSEDIKKQEAVIRKNFEKIIEILVPIIGKLDKEFEIKEQYKNFEYIKTRLKASPSKEAETLPHIKSLFKQIAHLNNKNFFDVFNAVLKPILSQPIR